MAGVSDLAFRTVCRQFGATLAVTEMVSSKALVYRDRKTLTLLQTLPDDHPVSAQIFGSEPETMAQAAVIALEYSNADMLDINMGCPVGKIVKNGDGAALMLKPELAGDIIKAVAAAAHKPVTVKFRRGFDKGHLNAAAFAEMCEASGASGITIHGRTRAQMYEGTADWDSIREAVRSVSIPVIANGDIFSAEDALRCLSRTGAAGVMVGRAAMGNPWIFREIKAALEGSPIPPRPSLKEIADTAEHHVLLAAELKGERLACLEARRHFAWYLRGIKNAAIWRRMIVETETLADIKRIANDLRLNAGMV